MTLALGTKIEPYEIVGTLGAGGMGEVYRARDTRLGRFAAIKVLPSFLSNDPERLRRFELEARAAAALNHPNILAIFQLGTYEGAPYLVSELLEGATLREHLARGPLSVRKAIDYGVQIAHGLSAAHEKGIAHRDLKPENLFVTKDGRIKILDFGLAKLTQPQSPSPDTAPTITLGTEPGVVIGTVGYMSPEQVRGRWVDCRGDIFAFGVILYEMLTGKRAFQKPTSPETMTAILNEEPRALSELAPATPLAMQRIVHRCLEKNPEQRFQSSSDLAFALEGLSDSSTSSDAHTEGRPWRFSPRAFAAVFTVIAALTTTTWWLLRSRRAIPTPTLTRLTWDSGLTTDPALSWDGKLLAYASDRSGEAQLDIYVQQVGGGSPLRLTQGPGDKRHPSFSPDGTTIAFDSGDGIYIVSTLGGSTRRIAAEGQAPQFSPDGESIAYSTGGAIGAGLSVPGQARMYVVASTGGAPRQLRSDFIAALWPIWAPDGQHLLFLGNPDASKPPEETVDWWVTPLTSGPATRTGALERTRGAKLAGDSQIYPWALAAPTWEPDGRGLVFYARSGDSINLWRIAISPTTFKAAGVPQRLTSGLTREEGPSVASGIKGAIRIAFTSIGDTFAVWSLPINSTEGKVTGELRQLTQNAEGGSMPYISRDGNRLAFVSVRPGNQEIWTKDLRTGEESALTVSRVNKYSPTISPDGSLVSFNEVPSDNVYVVPSNGGVAENICPGCGEATGWSSDGKRILGNTLDGKVWVLDVATRARTDLLATGRWTATWRFSPDNRWFSFIVVDKGALRAYIARVDDAPVPESKWIEIMNDGEAEAWSHDGNLLYGISERDGHMCIWAQRLHPTTRQPAGAPFAVFHAHSPRLSLAPENVLSITTDKIVFGMVERTGNIWMAEWKQR